MEKMMMVIKKFWKEEEGTETVEWAVVAGLVIVAAAGTWVLIGGHVTSIIGRLEGAVGTADVAPAG